MSKPIRVESKAEAFILVCLLYFASVCLTGWAFMLAIGVLSSESVVDHTISFWPAVAVALLLRVALTAKPQEFEVHNG